MAGGDETHLSTDMMRMMWQLATGNRFAIVCIVIAKNKMITINIKSPRTTNKTLETELFPRVARTQRTSLSLSHTHANITQFDSKWSGRVRARANLELYVHLGIVLISFPLVFAIIRPFRCQQNSVHG